MNKLLKLPYTQLFIDWQPGFPASQSNSIIAAGKAVIAKAKADGMPIVFLETPSYRGTGPGETDYRLLAQMHNYDPKLWAMAYKSYYSRDEDAPHSGAEGVDYVCKKNGYPTEHFRVCGVNTNICVFLTMKGLRRRYPNALIELVAHACNDESYKQHDLALTQFRLKARDLRFVIDEAPCVAAA